MSSTPTQILAGQEPKPGIPPGVPPVEPGGFGGGDGGGGDDGDVPRHGALYRFGLLLALASIAMLFLATAALYVTRSRIADNWQPVRVPAVLWASTVVLLLSSLTLETARRALRRDNVERYRARLGLTTALGWLFVVLQAAALWQLGRMGLYANGNPHAFFYYLFAGLHAAHVLGGMVFLHRLLTASSRGAIRLGAQLVAWYWHFLSAVWLGLMTLLAFV